MPQLIVTKSTGELLFDTSKITYGLIKSGYMSLIATWPRQYIRSTNLDPNDGGSWMDSSRAGDDMYGFSVVADSPIVFITGPGTLNGMSLSGTTKTFLYAGATAATKFYCFDLMAGNLTGSPYLKTCLSSGQFTFNSLQYPMNVVAAIQAPSPPALDQYGRYPFPYAGGYRTRVRNQTASVDVVTQVFVDVTLSAGIEYAAFLPWARSVSAFDTFSLGTNSGPTASYSMSEGAYGRTGGISFMFAPSGRTPENPGVSGTGYTIPISFSALPVDRFPQALVIQTAGLPFPFN